MKVNLKVTQKNIDEGQDGADDCPIALALKDALPAWDEVEVDGNIRLNLMEPMDGYLYRHEYLLRNKEQVEKISEFVGKYDGGKKVEPFELELDFEEQVYEPPDPEY